MESDYINIIDILGHIADRFSANSKEADAISKSIETLLIVQHNKDREQYKNFISKKITPLTGFDIMRLKYYGIDIPDKFRTPKVLELNFEIDMLVSKISSYMNEYPNGQ
jgi:hypothetical protein